MKQAKNHLPVITSLVLVMHGLLCATQAFAWTPKHIILIVADDLGYSDLGCFGSEIATPNIDSLGRKGTIFTSFYTAPTCSPSRAMLLTGVDHHLAGMGNMVEFRTRSQFGQAGYEGHLNDRVVCMAQVLHEAGYVTAIAGKWHLGYEDAQLPTANGFERSWVLLNGFASHFAPRPSRIFKADGRDTSYPAGVYATEHYTTKAIEFVRDAHLREQPLFLYLAYTAPHWPLEAPQDAIDKHRGKYNDGYDQLRLKRTKALEDRKLVPAGIQVARPTNQRPYLHPSVPVRPLPRAWDQLSQVEQALSASRMEVYAAMVDVLDQQIGRLLNVLDELNMTDDSVIFFMSDNGAAPSEATGGGYGPDWARACMGPFRLVKGYPTEGGIRSPCIISLPGQEHHRVTGAFASMLDIAPTCYEVAGIDLQKVPTELPLEGRSLLTFLNGRQQTVHAEDHGMGWELFGRGAYREGAWKIVSVELPFGKGRFELFNLRDDPGEAIDLSENNPGVLRHMVEQWNAYAKRVNLVSDRPFD